MKAFSESPQSLIVSVRPVTSVHQSELQYHIKSWVLILHLSGIKTWIGFCTYQHIISVNSLLKFQPLAKWLDLVRFSLYDSFEIPDIRLVAVLQAFSVSSIIFRRADCFHATLEIWFNEHYTISQKLLYSLYLGSGIILHWLIIIEVSTKIQRCRMVLPNLHYLWHQ